MSNDQWTTERIVIRGLHMSCLTMCEIGRWARERPVFGYVNQHEIDVAVGQLTHHSHVAPGRTKDCDVCGRVEQGWELTPTGVILDAEWLRQWASP